MDRRERKATLHTALLAQLGGWQAKVWTALPVIVQSFDPIKQTCVVLPATQARVQDRNGTFKWVTINVISDCPVFTLGGGDFVVTFPIAPGDDGLMVIASRCIDGWWQSGGPNATQPPDLRMHDLSDGFVFVGPRSLPRALPGYSVNSAQLRSEDGLAYVELAGGHIINIVAPGGLNISANTIIAGTVTANGHRIDETHKHKDVTAGAANTGVVV